jgi:hypothetical protein
MKIRYTFAKAAAVATLLALFIAVGLTALLHLA